MSFIKYVNFESLTDEDKKALKQELQAQKKALRDQMVAADKALAALSKPKAKKAKK